MRYGRQTGLLALMVLMLAVAGWLGTGCDPGGGITPASGQGADSPGGGTSQPGAVPNGPFPLARPSEVSLSLRQAKQVSSILERDASDFVAGYSQRVNPAAPEALYTPSWTNGYSSFATVAYAIYRFDLAARSGRLGISTTWTQGLKGDKLLWLGASNWERDRWDWSSGGLAGVVDLGETGIAKYRHPETAEMYVAVVVLGADAAMLSKVRLTCSRRGDWCMYRHDAGHCAQACSTGPEYPALRWRSGSLDITGCSLPVFDADGNLYITNTDKNDQNLVYAINPDGVQQWQYQLDLPETTGLVIAAVGDDGTVYASLASGRIYALNPDGTKKWACGLETGMINAAPEPATLGADGTIYMTIDGQYGDMGALLAYSPDGVQEWRCDFTGTVTNPVAGADGTLYVGCSDNKLVAVNPDGTQQWVYGTGSPVLIDPVAAAGGKVLVIDSTANRLDAVDSNGTLAWSYQLPGQVDRAPAAIADGSVCVSCTNGFIYMLDPAGLLRWCYYTAGDSGVAADAKGTVYAAGHDGRLYAIAADGQLKWWYENPVHLLEAPVVGEDGTVYYLDVYGELFAVGPGGGLARHSVSGYVTNGGGGGIAGAAVCITGMEPVQSDAQGHWQVDGVPAGAYIAAAQKDGYDFTPLLQQFDVEDNDVVLADFTGSPSAAAAWQMFGKDRAHTRRADHSGPTVPVLKWSCMLADNVIAHSPAIGGDGTVYFSNYAGGIYAFSPGGSLRWQRDEDSIFNAAPALGPDGTLYTTYKSLESNILRAFTPGGSYKWSYALPGSESASLVIGQDGTLYLCGGEKYNAILSALHPDGTVAWVFPGVMEGNSPAVDPSGNLYAIKHDAENSIVCAISPQGTELWSAPVFTRSGDPDCCWTVLADDGTVFACAGQVLCALTPAGEEKWRYQTPYLWMVPPAVGADNTLYTGPVQAGGLWWLSAIDETGAVKWNFYLPDTVFSNMPTLDAGGTVYIGGCTYYGEGEERIADCRIYAINPDGTLKWTVDDVEDLVNEIAIGADGVLYFGDLSGNVYAVGEGGV